MSRSYKKHPWITDHKCRTTKNLKRLANQSVRRRINQLDELPTNHGFSKKMTERWDICDYKWRMTREEAIDYWTTRANNPAHPYFIESWPTLEKYMKMWSKYHYRK